jgi:hypothetical protein
VALEVHCGKVSSGRAGAWQTRRTRPPWRGLDGGICLLEVEPLVLRIHRLAEAIERLADAAHANVVDADRLALEREAELCV